MGAIAALALVTALVLTRADEPPAPRSADGCRRQVAPDLAFRVTALLEPAQPGSPLPAAARDALNSRLWPLDAVVEEGAREWGGNDRFEISGQPPVPRAVINLGEPVVVVIGPG